MTGENGFLDAWVDLDEILPWLPSEPYFVQEIRHREVVDGLVQGGFSVFEVDLSDVRTERDLLILVGQALSAPDYYGKNWDALRDILHDRGADDPFSIAIVFSASHAFLDANVHEFVRSVTVLQMMARELSNVDEDYGRLELFYIGRLFPNSERAA